MRKLITATAMLALAGCASIETPLDDGYQLGDIGNMRDDYCENADPRRRAVLLAIAYRAGVPLPPNGACADILEALDVNPNPAQAADAQSAE